MNRAALNLARAPTPTTRSSSRDPDSTLPLALLLVFPTIGLEQLIHTSDRALASLPVYEALHWLSDSLLALPLAMLAVWGGRRLAARLDLGSRTWSDLVARACLIAILFALTLVPGAALHDEADSLTHAHANLSIHNHAPLPALEATQAGPIDEAASLAAWVVHALTDGFTGQAIALPLIVLAMWEVRKHQTRNVLISAQREG